MRRPSEMTAQSPFLIPPRRFEAHGGFCSLPPEAEVCLTAPTPPVAAMRLLEVALPQGMKRRIRQGEDFSLTLSLPEIELDLPEPDSGGGTERYAVRILPQGLAARAVSAEGLFRACAFVRRALQEGALPCGLVQDAPSKSLRGLMLDVSRNRTYSVQTLMTVVDHMAQVGMNHLELYFENVFAYRDHAAVWAATSPYTPEDIAALEAYAAARFVRLIPNQNTLGHFERWLVHPDYRRYAELPQGGARTPWGTIQEKPTGLFAADPETRTFVKGLLEELLPCFPRADWVNLGGDEVFDLGQGRSKTDDKVTLYLDYMREMAETAARKGKRPELWADMLLRHSAMLPRAKAVLPTARWLVWGYEASDPIAANVAKLRAEGLEVVACPGTSSWRSFCGRTANMLENIRAAATSEASGVLLTDWGDAGHWQPLTITYPALVCAAALAWSPESTPDVAKLTDSVLGERGIGEVLMRLGNTYLTAKAEASNATKLFIAYHLPLDKAPSWEEEALKSALEEVETLAAHPALSGESLAVRETRYALGLQQLALLRALKTPKLHRLRARLAAQMACLWMERGALAQRDASLEAFLSAELPT